MVSNQYDYCIVASRTDVGCKRAANEDSMGQLDTINGRVVVVCDGMGGHVGGATASKIAVETILEFLNGQRFDDIREGMGMAIDAANRAILAYANVHPELTGMGSTCVLLVIREGLVYIAHVGDSRIYLVRNRIITQLTKDHSYVQMLVDNGEITKEQAEHHPRKNEITNALGIPQMTPATVKEDAILPEAGDSFLLCSDGLSGPVEEKVINKIVSDHTIRVQQRVDMLIEKARENGGPDNITAQIVEFVMTPKDLSNSKAKIRPVIWYALGSIVLIAIGIILFFILKPQTSETNDNSSNEDTESLTPSPTEQTPVLPSVVPDTISQSTNNNDTRVSEIPIVPKPTIENYSKTVGVGDSVVIRKMENQWMIRIGEETYMFERKWKLSQYDVDFTMDNTTNPTYYFWQNIGKFSESKNFVVIFMLGRNEKRYQIVAKKGELKDQILATPNTNVSDSASNNATNTTIDSTSSKISKNLGNPPQNQTSEESTSSNGDKKVQENATSDTITVPLDTTKTEKKQEKQKDDSKPKRKRNN